MMQHLPILVIVVPLMTAPLCVLVRERRAVFACALTVSWATFAGACLLLRQTLQEGVVSYQIGGWEPAWGIEYRVDPLGALVVLFVSFIGAATITFSPASVEREIPRGKQYLFFAAFLLCLTGLMGIAITGDLFNVFVFLEISSLSSYALISLGRSRRSLMAAFQYLVMGTIGATFLLIGIGLLYQMTGSLNMVLIGELLAQVPPNSRTLLVAIAFMVVGVSIKMALFPLHFWLPNAYTYAPSVVSVFIAATATKVSVYILLRLMFTIFQLEVDSSQFRLDRRLMTLALLGIFAASAMAIFQTNLKRLLAYSSIAQIGYMVLGISFASTSGLIGTTIHMFNHALIKGGLFMVVACFAVRMGVVNVSNLSGISRRMPWTCFAFTLGGLALIGVPVTAGFISKWYLLIAAFDAGYWIVAAMILLSSLLALVYIWRVVEVAYFGDLPEANEHLQEAPLSMLIPTYAVVGLTILFGVWTSLPAGAATQAVATLLGGAP